MVKLTYDQDPFKIQKPDLQRRTDTLLRDLLKRYGDKLNTRTRTQPLWLTYLLFVVLWTCPHLFCSAFVVETQPSMPQGKGQLVLRTNVQFSVKTRSVSAHCTAPLGTLTILVLHQLSTLVCVFIVCLFVFISRLLVKFPELNHGMKVNVSMDR